MIRKLWDKDRWFLTPQTEHARIAGLMAAAWNYGPDKPGDQVSLAISRHDDGWKEHDETPVLNESGFPRSFDEIPPEAGIPMWTRSVEVLMDEQKYYAAHLVATHFTAIARRNDSTLPSRSLVALGNFIGRMNFLTRKCKEAIANGHGTQEQKGGTGKVVRENYDTDTRFLQVCDLLSLLLVTDFSGQMEIENVPYLDGTDKLTVARNSDKFSLTISPLPFKKNLRDHVSAVILKHKACEDEDSFRSAYSGTKPTITEFHIGAS